MEIDNIRQQQSKKMINSIVTYCHRKKCTVDMNALSSLKLELQGSFDGSNGFGAKDCSIGTKGFGAETKGFCAETKGEYNIQSSFNNDKLNPNTNTSREKSNQYSVNPFFEVITLAAFQKDWKNLREIHKKLKIIEYMQTLDTPMEEKKESMNKLIDLVKQKKLTNDYVKYNYESCTIEHIDLSILDS